MTNLKPPKLSREQMVQNAADMRRAKGERAQAAQKIKRALLDVLDDAELHPTIRLMACQLYLMTFEGVMQEQGRDTVVLRRLFGRLSKELLGRGLSYGYDPLKPVPMEQLNQDSDVSDLFNMDENTKL